MIKLLFKLALTPSLWFRPTPTDVEWDDELLYILNNIHSIVEYRDIKIKLNNRFISIEPYTSHYGSLIDKKSIQANKRLPSRLTAIKLEEFINMYKRINPIHNKTSTWGNSWAYP